MSSSVSTLSNTRSKNPSVAINSPSEIEYFMSSPYFRGSPVNGSSWLLTYHHPPAANIIAVNNTAATCGCFTISKRVAGLSLCLDLRGVGITRAISSSSSSSSRITASMISASMKSSSSSCDSNTPSLESSVGVSVSSSSIEITNSSSIFSGSFFLEGLGLDVFFTLNPTSLLSSPNSNNLSTKMLFLPVVGKSFKMHKAFNLATVKEDVSSTVIVNSKPMAHINPFQVLRLLGQ